MHSGAESAVSIPRSWTQAYRVRVRPQARRTAPVGRVALALFTFPLFSAVKVVLVLPKTRAKCTRYAKPVPTTTPHRESSATPDVQSIAVLPFVNMSGNAEDEYFSDGLAEELLNSLARIDGLKVAARTTSFQYKNRSGDVSEIARQLRVAHILEGSVRRSGSGSRVRVTAQLIKASDGYHLWSESYDRQLQDIFEVQSDIAGRIAEKLRVELIPRPTTSDATAFDLLLRARHVMQHFTKWRSSRHASCSSKRSITTRNTRPRGPHWPLC